MATLLNELERTGGRYGCRHVRRRRPGQRHDSGTAVVVERRRRRNEQSLRRSRGHRHRSRPRPRRAHALAFARAGAKVVVNDLGVENDGRGGSSAPAHEVVEEIRGFGARRSRTAPTSPIRGDRRVVRATVEEFGRLDVVVNNALRARRMFVSCSEEEWDAVQRVHLKVTSASRAMPAITGAPSRRPAAPSMRASSTPRRRGPAGQRRQSAYSARRPHRGAHAGAGRGARALWDHGQRDRPVARTRMTEASSPT